MDGDGRLTNSDWVRDNPDAARAARDRHADKLESLGRCLWAGQAMSLDACADWIEARVQAGVRVIAIDPITLADPGRRETWQADHTFMARVETILKPANASLVLVSHPKKASGPQRSGPPTMDDLAGGAVYQRAARTVLFLSGKPDVVQCRVSGFGVQSAEINKRLSVTKARNGSGMHKDIGFRFDPATLRFAEMGEIVEDA